MAMADLIINLVYEGNGRFRTASKADLVVASDRFGQGEIIVGRVGKPRSQRQHNWFFAMISAAFENQTSGPLFDDAERLRKWLLIQAGHCDVKRFPPLAMSKDVAAWLKATRDDIDFSTDGEWIYAKTAKSISRKSCSGTELSELADKIIDIICEKLVPGSARKDWEPYVPVKKPAAKQAAVAA